MPDDRGVAMWRRHVAAARRHLEVGEGALAVAQLVMRPDSFGRLYADGGDNVLAGYIRDQYGLRQAALTRPFTVAPAFTYIVVDVDYAAAGSAAGCETLARRVAEFCDVAAPTGIDVVRVPTGGFVDHDVKLVPHDPAALVPVDEPVLDHGVVTKVAIGDDGFGHEVRRYRHEHLWIVTGFDAFNEPVQQWIAQRLKMVLPGTEIRGGARAGNIHGQQVRPPGSMHRLHGIPDGFDYEPVFSRLAAVNPPLHCLKAFLEVVEQLHRTVKRAGGRRHRIAPPVTDDSLEDWATDYLERGIPDVTDRSAWYPPGADQPIDRSRSAQLARLYSHMRTKGWEPAAMIERLVDSPAVACLTERQGQASVHDRVADDVERVMAKHHGRLRPTVPPVVHQVLASWSSLTLPDGGSSRWLTQSGRFAITALCREAAANGYLKVTVSKRTLGDLAGMGKTAAAAACRRWVALGVLEGVYDDAGKLDCIILIPAMLARLLPDELTRTQHVHAPLNQTATVPAKVDELLFRHDAWVVRPPGSANISVWLGRAGQAVAARLAATGGAGATQLAEQLNVGRAHVIQVLSRLRYHRLASCSDGIWQLETDPELLKILLDEAAQAQNTAGLLDERRRRYKVEAEEWARANELVGGITKAVAPVLAAVRDHRLAKRSRAAPGPATEGFTHRSAVPRRVGGQS